MSAQATFLFMLAGVAPANIVPLPGGQAYVSVRSYADLKFENMVRQQTDITCGAAALATILRHYYGFNVSEADVIETTLAQADAEQRENINKYGFSMLELKRAAGSFGLESGGFKLEGVNNLLNLKVPVIALTTVRGYAHFVVLRAARDGKVFIADPAFGNRTTPLKEFEAQWDGVILVSVRPSEMAGDPSFEQDFALYGDIRPIWTLQDSGLRNILAAGNEF